MLSPPRTENSKQAETTKALLAWLSAASGDRIERQSHFSEERRFYGPASFIVLPPLRAIGSFLFNALNNQTLTDIEVCYKMLSREVKDTLRITCNDFAFVIEISAQISLTGAGACTRPKSATSAGHMRKESRLTGRMGSRRCGTCYDSVSASVVNARLLTGTLRLPRLDLAPYGERPDTSYLRAVYSVQTMRPFRIQARGEPPWRASSLPMLRPIMMVDISKRVP